MITGVSVDRNPFRHHQLVNEEISAEDAADDADEEQERLVIDGGESEADGEEEDETKNFKFTHQEIKFKEANAEAGQQREMRNEESDRQQILYRDSATKDLDVNEVDVDAKEYKFNHEELQFRMASANSGLRVGSLIPELSRIPPCEDEPIERSNDGEDREMLVMNEGEEEQELQPEAN